VADRGNRLDQDFRILSRQPRLPIWARLGDVDLGQPWAVVLFVSSGAIGWSLLAAVLAFAPGGWAAPALGVAIPSVAAQYVAWWRMGGNLGALSPRVVRQMAPTIGLASWLGLVVVYGSCAWFAAGAVMRWLHGVAPIPPDRVWIQRVGAWAGVVGVIPVVLARVKENYGGPGTRWAARGGRTQRARWLGVVLRRANQVFFVLATVCLLAIVFAPLG
jgi:hypothetical protein